MSTDYNNVQSKRNTKLAIVAGILALGILAAALTGSQMLNAAAQTTGDKVTNSTDNAMNDKLYPVPPYYHGNGGASTVSTSGTGTTKVKPDKFSVTVGVETNGTTAEEAASMNADLMAKVVAALKGLGIKEDQISTSNYNVYPVYESKLPSDKVCIDIYPPPPECGQSQVITGYRASNSVTVTLDAQGAIDAGKVIDASINAGANNVNGVYFFISPEKQQEIRDSLIKDAIANARHRADVAASALGMQVSGVQSVNLNDVYFPVYYGKSDAGLMSSGAPTQILPGEQEISTSVNVVFYINTIMTDGQSGNETSTTPGMLKTNNTDCVNPPNGPMIC